MQDQGNLSEEKIDDTQKIIHNRELSLGEALIPVLILVAMLAYNIFAKDGEWLGGYSNQIILLIGGGISIVVGLLNKTTIEVMAKEIWENLKSVFVPIMILFLVGALAGTWLISGVIPAMVYYGLQVLSPEIFLPASVIIAAIISIATGSSWTTSATVGIALIGIGSALGINAGMIAGAVISGAYFGDKMSPLSDTTNLAPAMAGTDLYTHIKYMALTTIPSITITLIIFTIISMNLDTSGVADTDFLLKIIDETFNITPYLFLVPLTVIVLIIFKVKPLIALSSGVIMAIIFAVIFQTNILDTKSSYSEALTTAVLTDIKIESSNEEYLSTFSLNEIDSIKTNEDLNKIFTDDDLKKPFSNEELSAIFAFEKLSESELTTKVENLNKLITIKKLSKLFKAGGMNGMVWTILLIISAMIFGGIMDGIGALGRITRSLLKMVKSVFGLFASTVVSCLGLNIIASDQYLALVIPGKMFKKAYEDRGLAPENLSRTLEDSGTVTSALIPWNTCGAYQSGVLGVGVGEYFIYAFFNWISPIMTLVFVALGIKIRKLVTSDSLTSAPLTSAPLSNQSDSAQ